MTKEIDSYDVAVRVLQRNKPIEAGVDAEKEVVTMPLVLQLVLRL